MSDNKNLNNKKNNKGNNNDNSNKSNIKIILKKVKKSRKRKRSSKFSKHKKININNDKYVVRNIINSDIDKSVKKTAPRKNRNNKRKNPKNNGNDDDNKRKKSDLFNKKVLFFIGLPPEPKDGSDSGPFPPNKPPPPPSYKINTGNDDDYFETDDKLYPIDKDIKNLDDLIELAKSYDPDEKKKYVINLKVLNRCLDSLIELNNMIGMKDIKQNIINLFFFYLQNLYKDGSNNQMLHTIIEGKPGSGKTEVAKILAKIYFNLGIIKTSKFIIARRSDLIGKYLGHTAANTQDIFNKAENGVIFIDEAYSLGNKQGTDSFSKECIDTINQNLTEKKGKVIVIIAGYKKQLEESFFSYNPGLIRRFPFRYTIGEYTSQDLMDIYKKMVKDNEWELSDKNKITLKFFEKNKVYFKYNGGDMETMWNFTKITHSRRVFGKDISKRKKITQKDLDEALKLFISNDEIKKRNDKCELLPLLYV